MFGGKGSQYRKGGFILNIRKPVLLAIALIVCLMTVSLASAEAPRVVDDPIGEAQDYLTRLNDEWKAIGEEYAPEVRTLKNGVKVQRTPSEYQITGWMWQSDTISYNTYWLDADHRGCQACHVSLDDLIKNMNRR